MEAVIIDVTPDYFSSADDDLRTDADLEEFSITDENGHQFSALTPDVEDDALVFEKINSELRERSIAPPKRPPRRKNEANRQKYDEQMNHDSDTFHSFSLAKEASERHSPKEDTDKSEHFTDAVGETSDSQSIADTFMSAKESPGAHKIKKEEFAYKISIIEENKEKSIGELQTTKSSPAELVRNITMETVNDKPKPDKLDEHKPDSDISKLNKKKEEVKTLEEGKANTLSNLEATPKPTKKKRKSQDVVKNESLVGTKDEHVDGDIGSLKKERLSRTIKKSKSTEKSYQEPQDTIEPESNEAMGQDYPQKIVLSLGIECPADKTKSTESLKSKESSVEKDNSYSEEGDGLKTFNKRKEKSTKKRKGSVGEGVESNKARKRSAIKKAPPIETDEHKMEVEQSFTAAKTGDSKPLKRKDSKKTPSLDSNEQNVARDDGVVTAEEESHIKKRKESKRSPSVESNENKFDIDETMRIVKGEENSTNISAVDSSKQTESYKRTICENTGESPKETKHDTSKIRKTKKQRTISSTEAELPKLAALGIGHTVEVDTMAAKIEPTLLESLTQSLLDIQRSLVSVEEKIISQSTNEPHAVMSSLSVLETLTQPIQDSIALVEEQAALESSSEEHSLGKTSTAILETISQPMQEFQRGLALVEKQAAFEESKASLLEITSLSILENVAQPVQELNREIVFIQEQAAIHQAESGISKKMIIPSFEAKLLQDKESADTDTLLNISFLECVINPVSELKKEIEILKEQAVMETNREFLAEKPSTAVLVALSKPLRDLQKGISLIAQQAEYETLDSQENKNISKTTLNALIQPLEELNANVRFIEQQASLETEDTFLPLISKFMIVKSLAEPIQELSHIVSSIQQHYVQEPIFRAVPYRDVSPVTQIFAQSLEELKKEIEIVKNIQLLSENIPSVSETEKTTIFNIVELLQPLTDLQNGLSQSQKLFTGKLIGQDSEKALFDERESLMRHISRPSIELQDKLSKIEYLLSNAIDSSSSGTIIMKESLALLKEPVQELKINIADIHQISFISSGSDTDTVKFIEATMAHLNSPLKAFTNVLSDIEQHIAIESASTFESSNVNPKFVKSLAQSIKELECNIATIDKQKQSENNSFTKPNEVTEIQELKEPLLELKEGLVKIMQDIILEENLERGDETPTSGLITLVQPLGKLEMCLALTEGKLEKELNTHKQARKSSLSSAKTLIQPIQQLHRDIVEIQQLAILSTEGLGTESTLDVLSTLEKPLQNLHRALDVVEKSQETPQILSALQVENVVQSIQTIQESISKLEHLSHQIPGENGLEMLANLSAPLKYLENNLLEGEEILLQEENINITSQENMYILQSLSKPLKEFHREMVKLQNLAIEIQSTPESLSTISISTSIIEPLNKLEHQIEIVTKQAKAVITDKTHMRSIYLIDKLIHPLETLQESLSAIEKQNVLSGSHNSPDEYNLFVIQNVNKSVNDLKETLKFYYKPPTDEIVDKFSTKDTSILNSLSEPLTELQQSLNQFEQQLLGSGVKAESTMANISLLAPLTEPLKDLTKEIMDVERRKISLSNDESTKADFSIYKLETFIKPIQQLQQGISLVQVSIPEISGKLSPETIALGTLVESLNHLKEQLKKIGDKINSSVLVVRASQPVINSFTNSISELQKGFELIELQAFLDSDEEPMSERESLSILEGLAHPLEKLRSSLVQIEEHCAEEGLDGIDNVALKFVTKVAPSVEEVLKGIALIGKQASLETDSEPLSDITLSLVENLAQPMQELRKGLAQIQQHVILESCGSLVNTEESGVSSVEISRLIPQEENRGRVVDSRSLHTEESGVASVITSEIFPLRDQMEISDLTETKFQISDNDNSITSHKPVQQPMSIKKLLHEIEQQIVVDLSSSIVDDNIANQLLKTMKQPIEDLQSKISKRNQEQPIETPNEQNSEESFYSLLDQTRKQMTTAIATIQNHAILHNNADLEKCSRAILLCLASSPNDFKLYIEESLKSLDKDLFNTLSLSTIPKREENGHANKAPIVEGTLIYSKNEPIYEHCIALLGQLTTPVQQLQQAIASVQQHGLSGESHFSTSSPLMELAQPIQELQMCVEQIEREIFPSSYGAINEVRFKTIAQAIIKPFEGLHKNIALIDKYTTIEDVAKSLITPHELSILEAFSEPVEKLKKYVALIEQQVCLEPNESLVASEDVMTTPLNGTQDETSTNEIVLIEDPDKLETSNEIKLTQTYLSDIETVSKHVKELMNIIYVIEKQVGLESTEPLLVQSNISALQTLAKPLEEIQMYIGLVEKRQIIEGGEYTMPDQKNISALKALSKPIEELQNTLIEIGHKVVLEEGGDPLRETYDISLSKNITIPLQEIKQCLSLIQEQEPIYIKEETMPEKSLLIESLTKATKELEKEITIVEKQEILELYVESLIGSKSLTSLGTFANPILELTQAIALLKQQALIVSEGGNLSEKSNMQVLETIAKPLRELQISLAQVEQQIITEDVKESKKAVFVAKALATPLILLENEIIKLEEQLILEQQDCDISEIPEISLLKKLACSVNEIKKQLAHVEMPQVLENIDQSMTDGGSTSEHKNIAELIKESKYVSDIYQELVIVESNTEKLTDNLELSVTEQIESPLEELYKSLVKLETQMFLQDQTMNEPEIFTLLTILAKSIAETKRQIASINHDIVSEGTVSDIDGLNQTSILRAVSHPIKNLQQAISTLEQITIATGEHTLAGGTDSTLLKSLIKPIKEVKESISLVQSQVGISLISEELGENPNISPRYIEYITQPMHELLEAVNVVHNHIFETVGPVPENKDIVTTNTIFTPLQELKAGLEKIKTIELESGKISDSKASYALLQVLAHPMQELEKGIELLEKPMVIETGSRSSSEEVDLLLLSKLSKTIQEMKKGLIQIDKQKLLSDSQSNRDDSTKVLEVVDLRDVASISEEFGKRDSEKELKTLIDASNQSMYGKKEEVDQTNFNELNLEGNKHIQDEDIINNKVDETGHDNNDINMTKTKKKKVVSHEEREKIIADCKNNTVKEDEQRTEEEAATLGAHLVVYEIETKNKNEAQKEIGYEANDENIVGKNILSDIETLAKPVKELMNSIYVAEKQIGLESNEPLLGQSNITALQSLVHPLEEIQRYIALVEKQQILEGEEYIMPDQKNISALKALSKPIEELQNTLIEIDHKVVLEAEGDPLRETYDISLLKNITIPLQEIKQYLSLIQQQEPIYIKEEPMFEISPLIESLTKATKEHKKEITIVEKQEILEPYVESLIGSKSLTSLGTFANPILELTRDIALIEQQALIVSEGGNLSEKSNMQVLETIAKPLREFQISLAQVEQQVITEDVKESKKAVFVAKALATPLILLENEILKLEEQLLLSPQEYDTSEIPAMSLLKTLSCSVIEVKKHLAHVEVQKVLENIDKSDVGITSEVKTSAVYLDESQKFVEPIEKNTPEKIKLSDLEQMENPLIELYKSLVHIEQKIILQECDRAMYDPDSFRLVTALAKPIDEVKRQIELLDDEIGSEKAALKGTSTLHTVTNPIQNLQQAISQLEQATINTTTNTMSDKTDLYLLKELAKPISEVKERISLVQEHAEIELNNEKICEKQIMSTMEKMSQPIHELLEALNAVQKNIMESVPQISENKATIDLNILAAPIQELKTGLEKLEKLSITSGKLCDSKASYALLKVIAIPMQELQKGIALVEKSKVRQIGGGSISEEANLILLKKLSKPLREMEKGLIKIEKQNIFATSIQSVTSDVTVVSNLATLTNIDGISKEFEILSGKGKTNVSETSIQDLCGKKNISEGVDEPNVSKNKKYDSELKELEDTENKNEEECKYKGTEDIERKKDNAGDNEHKKIESEDVEVKTKVLEEIEIKYLETKEIKNKKKETKESVYKIKEAEEIKLKIIEVEEMECKLKESGDVELKSKESERIEYKNKETGEIQEKKKPEDVESIKKESKEIERKKNEVEEIELNQKEVEEIKNQKKDVDDIEHKNKEAEEIEKKNEGENEIELKNKEAGVIECKTKEPENDKPIEKEAEDIERKKKDAKEIENKREEAEEFQRKKNEALKKKEAEDIKPKKKEAEKIEVKKKEEEIEIKNEEAEKNDHTKNEAEESEIKSKEVDKIEIKREEVKKIELKNKSEEIETKRNAADEVECEKKEAEEIELKNKEAVENERKNEEVEIERKNKETEEIEIKRNKVEEIEIKRKEVEEIEIKRKTGEEIECKKKEAEEIECKNKETKEIGCKTKESKITECKKKEVADIELKNEEEEKELKNKEAGDITSKNKEVEEIESKNKQAEEIERKIKETEGNESKKKEAEEIERKNKEEEEIENKKKEAEGIERKKKEAEEIERKNKEAEENESKKKEAEEIERKNKEAEEIENKKKEVEEIESQKKEAKKLEHKKKEAEEIERKNKEDENEIKKKEAEGIERKKKEAEEIECKNKEAEEIENKKKEAKEIESKKKEAKKLERKKKEAEEIESKKKDSEEIKRKNKQAEEIERKNKEAEENAIKMKEEEEIERKKKEAEEIERKNKEVEENEIKRKEAEEIERKKKEAVEIECKKKEAEEIENKKKEAEEIESKKKEAKNLERKKKEAEEIERKKKDSEEIKCKNKQAEEFERKIKEAEAIESKKKEAEEIESKNKQAEQIERKNKEAEENETKRKETEDIERKNKQAEDIERKKKEAEEIQCKNKEAEEIENKKKEAKEIESKNKEAKKLERKKREAEEIERKKREAEEIERKKNEAEEIECKNKEAVEIERKNKEVEEIEIKKKEADEIEHKNKEVEENEIKRKEAENIERKKKEAEEIECKNKEAEEIENKNKEAEEIESKKKEAQEIEFNKPETVEIESKKRKSQKSKLKKKEPEEIESKKKEADEIKRKNKEAEENEIKRKEAEDIERKKKEAEKIECKNKEAEEIENKKKEAEEIESKKKEADEIERKNKEAEDNEIKRKEEDIERKKKEAEEIECKKKEAEEIEIKKKEAEEIESKKKEAKKLELKKKEAEEIERKKKDSEEIKSKNKQAEEIERKNKEEEENEIKKKEEEGIERKKKETKKLERKKKEVEEVERKKKDSEEIKTKNKQAEEIERKNKEAQENEIKMKEAEEIERKKKEAEEIERKNKEAEENEIKRKEAEDIESKNKEAQENEIKMKEAEEIERKKKEAEEIERKNKEAEENDIKRKEAEDIERKKKEAVEIECKKKESEEIKRKKKEAEDVDLKKKEAEEFESKKRKSQKSRLKKKEPKESECKSKEAEVIERKNKEAEDIEQKKKEAENYTNCKETQHKLMESEKDTHKSSKTIVPILDIGVGDKTESQENTSEPITNKDKEEQKLIYGSSVKNESILYLQQDADPNSDVVKITRDVKYPRDKSPTDLEKLRIVEQDDDSDNKKARNRITDRATRRARSYDQGDWKEEESLRRRRIYDDAMESSETLTASTTTTTTLTPFSARLRVRDYTAEDSSLASMEDLPLDHTRRSRTRERVEVSSSRVRLIVSGNSIYLFQERVSFCFRSSVFGSSDGVSLF
uniref:Uncharacterized protein n=1 Tax=Timema monikensis TaxID=170555 RepID=A0A7R9E703_9NEOP|nr:unnamed protein product [Timema monikensis]